MSLLRGRGFRSKSALRAVMTTALPEISAHGADGLILVLGFLLANDRRVISPLIEVLLDGFPLGEPPLAHAIVFVFDVARWPGRTAE